MAAVRPTALAASRPTPAAARPAEPVSESRAEWVKRAERDRKKLETDRRAHYAVQLELVCEVDSLAEAWKHDKNQTMWLLTTNHAGRDCFRVLWGRYPTLEAAKKGKSAIPAYFVTARNRPAVVSVP
jgi:septal ring-binding cell division protein DamX